jgi:hypothetical protein
MKRNNIKENFFIITNQDGMRRRIEYLSLPYANCKHKKKLVQINYNLRTEVKI